MIDIQAITDMQKVTVQRWHESDIDNPHEGILFLSCCQHQKNYRLWHQEDIARSRDVSDAELAQVKRNIDTLNQQRNDLIEQLDDFLITELGRADVRPVSGAPLNTETPGSVIDRLSILSLRTYHMEEQAARKNASEEHRAKAKAKLTVIYEQQADLSSSLCQLLDAIFAGQKRLKVYRQFKMYNDPTMNPYLYEKKPSSAT